ncbi:CBF-domain-containing protein [Pseudovirgaria hyperparasitica]|uniref:CBF-domain-containing protein n=1 Tax=Pseudovirgaria hyperparasitica TaxID=470096 RepID=A0A6A6VV28_9PEZI|nr:CBF-domain-containing protein [Pseudovirgaria hyperparasitica]KAF2754083.1 CBF-domain-containing protein [Pseudovirgaria hyperparasitica]
MPYIDPAPTAGKKRRRHHDKFEDEDSHRSRRSKPTSARSIQHSNEAQIEHLESQISESRQYYNNIATLLSLAKDTSALDRSREAATIALCRVFCRLFVEKTLLKSNGTSENECVIIEWLEARLREYTNILFEQISAQDAVRRLTGLTLLMQLVKQESVQASGSSEAWRKGIFSPMLLAILHVEDEGFVKTEFVQKYVQLYDDIRYHTLTVIISHFSDTATTSTTTSNAILILSDMGLSLDSEPATDRYYGEVPMKRSKGLMTLNGHRKHAQDAWLSVFRSNLSQQQRKRILSIMARRIVPLLLMPEVLMDFLTDCYNEGGSLSLLALSGLYHLMTEKNLDYPSFYEKLYSLLDSELLHSKHRSKFFRLLEEFLASTHLPAVMVASFIKRLARLSLFAPPAGIVVVIPWIYNMLKRHPACTFMIHRVVRDPQTKVVLEAEGMDDPFDMEESNPMETGAIESSLWEIETLQSVYHPNVATLANVISEQFTKRSYNLEDFLDHTYSGMIDAELKKNLKRAPEVEYHIPKRIFTAEDSELSPLGELMTKVLQS